MHQSVDKRTESLNMSSALHVFMASYVFTFDQLFIIRLLLCSSLSSLEANPHKSLFSLPHSTCETLLFFGFWLIQMADAMEMMILSILAPQLHCEWRLPSWEVALLTSVQYLSPSVLFVHCSFS